jgi:hypothetical protein
MCVSCGCKKYEDNHGDPRNITLGQLRQAAESGGVSLEDVAKNVGKRFTRTQALADPCTRQRETAGAERIRPAAM